MILAKRIHFNPDCELDEICIMAESESTSEASAISSSKKKHVNSKKRVLTKADQRKHLSERLQLRSRHVTSLASDNL